MLCRNLPTNNLTKRKILLIYMQNNSCIWGYESHFDTVFISLSLAVPTFKCWKLQKLIMLQSLIIPFDSCQKFGCEKRVHVKYIKNVKYVQNLDNARGAKYPGVTLRYDEVLQFLLSPQWMDKVDDYFITESIWSNQIIIYIF